LITGASAARQVRRLARATIHFLRRCILYFRGEALREATAFSTAKSTSFAPALSFSRSHTGWAPRAAPCVPDLSRYLIGTLRPLRAPPRRARLLTKLSPCSIENWR